MSEVLTFVDVCAGGGGLSLGAERAGFTPRLLLEKEARACATLRANRPGWNVLQADLLDFEPEEHKSAQDVDLLLAGLPRVKSSSTVTRAGSDTEIRLIRATIYLTHSVQPRALVVENVPGFVESDRFAELRSFARAELAHLGYRLEWFVLNAADFGVPQDRKQGVLVAIKEPWAPWFERPVPTVDEYVSVGRALVHSMGARGWGDADRWAAQADKVAPTLVGGSDKRGGADLGPRGSKAAWARMGVNAGSLGDEVPGPDFVWDPGLGKDHMAKITVEQAAVLQGFPTDWVFQGRKTARYRQIGHASPPPVGEALARSVAAALTGRSHAHAGYTSAT
ncbi:DNA cytosine methyltransferase [Streptomyces sp. SID5785]|uniref:DNA cytosine methyltransferase n=1 Tax=Streptomyces sp. SID5785 TaxID=2690309 RepID=UPI001360BC07|nr:DNA cytosine methyltransferase [Streptomyces sp. SID5785]MZD05787.1 DNA cytosine methyltransferase [Streptomyces sp. SID5785]